MIVNGSDLAATVRDHLAAMAMRSIRGPIPNPPGRCRAMATPPDPHLPDGGGLAPLRRSR